MIECRADRRDTAIHHVRWRDDVAAGLGLHQRLLHQHLDRLVVDDRAVAQQPVMAVAGIGIERDVAEDADLRHLLLDRADGAADQVVRIERFAAVLVAPLGIGIGKQRDAGDGKLGGPLGVPHRLIDREPLDARHRRHRDARLRPVDQEQRPDQIVRGQDVLAHHAPRPLGLPVAARAGGEVEPLDRPGFDRGETGFDRTAVLDGHCGAPCLIGPKSWWPFLTVPRKARQRRRCGAGAAGPPWERTCTFCQSVVFRRHSTNGPN